MRKLELTESENEFWLDYLNSVSIPAKQSSCNVEASPAGNYSITDQLIELYLTGKKTAGSSLVEGFEFSHDPLPEIGDFWIVLNGKNQPRLILKTIKIEIHRFRDVPEYVAIAEGEGDLSLEYWKKSHKEFYKSNIQLWGIKDIDDAHVITEHFEVVWK